MYLPITAYKSMIRDRRFQQIIDEDNDVVAIAESEAIAMISSRLSSRYDTDFIFNITVDADKPKIVQIWLKRIVLYLIHGRLPGTDIPKHIIDDYAETIAKIDSIEDGESEINIKRKTALDAHGNPINETKFRYGSNSKRTHD
jgi:hypothetical protein